MAFVLFGTAFKDTRYFLGGLNGLRGVLFFVLYLFNRFKVIFLGDFSIFGLTMFFIRAFRWDVIFQVPEVETTKSPDPVLLGRVDLATQFFFLGGPSVFKKNDHRRKG